jgi:outer membrane biogenesis lipoprotein LolB
MFQESESRRKGATNLRRYLWVVAVGMLLVGCASGLSSPSSSEVDTENWQQYQQQEQMYDEGTQEAPPELPIE